MKKIEKYLYKRIDLLSKEKVDLIAKINKIVIEIEEVDTKIEEISSNLDTAYEIFSPKPKKNDFNKSEINRLEKTKQELISLRDEFVNQCTLVEEDIVEIKNALEEDDNDYELIDEYKKEKEYIATCLNDVTMQAIDDMIYKCDICMKIVDVDSIRTRMEMDMLSHELKNMQSKIRDIIGKLNTLDTDDINDAENTDDSE